MSSYTVLSYSSHCLPPEYRSLLYSKWLRSLRHGNDFFRLVEAEAYYEAYTRQISSILTRLDTVVRLAVLTDDKDVVLGFSISRGNILDYVYVQKDQRKLGIGTQLIPKGIEIITHLTKTGLSIWGSKYGKWQFNPFI